MKRTTLSFLLLLSIVVNALAGNKVWKKADIVVAYKNYLSVGSVTFADTSTIVEVIATKPGTKFKFTNETFLDCGDGKHYMVKECREFPLGQWIPGEGKDEVKTTFVFEPIPKSTKVFDLIEGFGSGMFKIYGIHDSKKPLNIKPFVCDNNALDDYRKNFFRTDTVCVKGRFEKLPKKRTSIIYHDDHFSDKDIPLSVDVKEDGTFERKFLVYHPVLNLLSFDHKHVPFYVEPGHTVNILIHQDGRAEYTDEEGNPAPCAAYLSSNINDISYLTWNQYEEDLKNLSFREYGKKIDDLMVKAEDDLSYLANRYGFTSLDYAVARTEMLLILGRWFLDYEMDKRHTKKDSITDAELKDLSNYKVLRRLPVNDTIILASHSYSILQNRYSYINVIWNRSKHKVEKEIDGRIHSYANDPTVRDSIVADIDSELFGVKELSMLAKIHQSYVEILHVDSKKELSMLAKIHLLNTFRKDDLKKMLNFHPSITEVIKAQIIAKNEERNRESVTRLKNMIGENVFSEHIDRIYQHYLDTKDYTYTLPECEGTNVLRNITNKFLGKYVFLDFWATTCAPCRAGIERTKAVREAMKDNPEVVFLFLTSDEESPKEDYDDYVAKHLKDEHVYRIPMSDYAKLRELFQFNGIPHYEILSKNGSVIRDDTHYYDIDSFNKLLEKIKENAE